MPGQRVRRRGAGPAQTSSSSSALSPLRILTQILTLQASYYACMTTLILFTALTAGKPFSIDLVLSWRSLRGDTAVGWTLGMCWLVGGGLSGTILLLLLIARSKLVPDFALTLHGIHLLITSFYSHSLPTNALWWLLQAGSATLMVAGGVWSCRWRELRPISFGGGEVTANGSATTTKGKGKGSAGGEYEMLNRSSGAAETNGPGTGTGIGRMMTMDVEDGRGREGRG